MRAAKTAGHSATDITIVAHDSGFIFEPTSGNAAAVVDAKPDTVAEGVQAGSTKARAKAKSQASAEKETVRARRLKAASPRKQPAAKTKGAKTKTRIKGKPAKQGSKGDLLESMLKRRGGASVPDLMKATGWQVHTLRARISVGTKQNRWKLGRERKDGVTSYRVGAHRSRTRLGTPTRQL
jgi:hypothetical protein